MGKKGKPLTLTERTHRKSPFPQELSEAASWRNPLGSTAVSQEIVTGKKGGKGEKRGGN